MVRAVMLAGELVHVLLVGRDGTGFGRGAAHGAGGCRGRLVRLFRDRARIGRQAVVRLADRGVLGLLDGRSRGLRLVVAGSAHGLGHDGRSSDSSADQEACSEEGCADGHGHSFPEGSSPASGADSSGSVGITAAPGRSCIAGRLCLRKGGYIASVCRPCEKPTEFVPRLFPVVSVEPACRFCRS
ncbi:hypothetical protein GLS_c11480 [Gluconobacter oxydans DSM 3504]|uniref:Uncharacterized protein n=1 Tax=Gluconobacter oxydans DSM 3504 TaxID=1288313 RepID=A0A067Z3H2_GLUOY|nr:hypothetical protein GLS_c11480 [Gluconobacter oxydans DSM 3504]